MSDRSTIERIAQLSSDERRLVEAAALADRPLPLTVAVQLGSWDESALLDVGNRLSTGGLIGQCDAGFTAGPDAAELVYFGSHNGNLYAVGASPEK